MSFNSYVFWVFLAVVLALYRRLPHRAQNWLLLGSSYLFYGWWDWRFLSLILLSTGVDYAAARLIEQTAGGRRRRQILGISLSLNLGLLAFFKYYGFFSHELLELLTGLGMPVSLPMLNIALPAGISFYTFQTMSYTIDVYRGELPAARRFTDFALYVAFFPHLVAGPIVRSSRLMPQLVEPRRTRPGDFGEGLYHVLSGLFKKVVIADNLAPIVNAIFATPAEKLSGLEVLVGVYAFALQIYGDFSGYSSIAQGVAKWMGIELMFNFRMPYLAASPREFWRRWHISLSTWLRDYLYIPLGGNRGGRWRTYRNLLLTMVLGGLWHGAGWTFLAWGAFHGLLLCGQRGVERMRSVAGNEEGHPDLAAVNAAERPLGPPEPARAWRHALRVILMFHAACLGWLLFRARTLTQARDMLIRLGSDPRVTPLVTYSLVMMAFFAGPLLVLEGWLNRRNDPLHLARSHWGAMAAVYSYFALMLWFFPPEVSHEFIYFQF